MKSIALLGVALLLTFAACSTDDGDDPTPVTDTASDAMGADSSMGSDTAASMDAAGAKDMATAADAKTSMDTAGAGDGATAGDTAGDTAKAFDWESMTFEERKAYMGKTVLPAMKKLFQEFDAIAFEKFDCATCHGSEVETGKFTMPNTPIPLDPQALPKPDDANAFMAKYATFMGGKVIPKMTELLGVKGLDPKTGTGFGCFSCHTKK